VDHRHGVAGDVCDLLVRLAGTLGDHDRIREREFRLRVGGRRAEQFLAMLVVHCRSLRAAGSGAILVSFRQKTGPVSQSRLVRGGVETRVVRRAAPRRRETA
jgi:hypothetical protein